MLIRQPNGKICICEFDGTIEKMNLTEEEYVEYCANKAREFVTNPENIKNFGELIKVGKVTDEELKEMGSEKTYKELLKFVPLAPVDTLYIPNNFETTGKCPSCGATVIDGMGGTDHKCPSCNQMIKWNNGRYRY